MTATGNAANWRYLGACRSADPDLFFPVPGPRPVDEQIARAKAICARCAVRQECLEFALSHNQAFGIWGGTTAEDRRLVRRRRRRAAAGGSQRRVSQRSMQPSSSSVSTGLVT